MKKSCATIVMAARGCLLLLALGCSAALSAAEQGSFTPEPLGNVKLPERPSNAHWVWIGDFQDGNYGRSILYNADSGEMLGSIDIGWEGIKLDFARTGNEIHNLAMYMSRGFHGERTDVITTYDKHTLHPLRELVVPAKGIHGWPDPNQTALSDDDRFLFMQFLTPASTIGVADIKAGKYVGEIETTGCAHVMSAGKRRFFSLCGDGSVLAVEVTEEGKEASRRRYPNFFQANQDPLHGSGVRAGNLWYFASWLGQIHSVDVSGSELKLLPPWRVGEKEGSLSWIPGAFMQPLAIHAGKGTLYVVMQRSDLKPKGGGTDYHAEPGSEVWVFDLKTKQRLKRMAMKYPVTQVAVSQDAAALLYANSMWKTTVTAYEESTGKELRDFVIPRVPSLIQPVH